MAHEIGHLLLPPKAHSQAGLMRADWTKADLQRIQRPESGASTVCARPGVGLDVLRHATAASRPLGALRHDACFTPTAIDVRCIDPSFLR